MIGKFTSLDKTGKEMASFIICGKILDLGNIIYYGLGTVGYTLLPSIEDSKIKKNIIDRIFIWSYFSHFIELMVILLFYWKCTIFTSDTIIITNIRRFVPYIYMLLISDGIGYLNFGILQGYQKYKSQAIISSVCLLIAYILLPYCKQTNYLLVLSLIISIITNIIMMRITR